MPRIFRYLEPTYFAGLIDDPCMVIRDRPIHKSIMIDCGALQHIAKREMKPVCALFVTHAHMDHFMGFDAFLRQVHASPRIVELFGPAGIADRVEARLSGYDWNLAEPYWCTFLVHEIHQQKILSSSFSGPKGFLRHQLAEQPRTGEVIYQHNHINVAAELLHHDIPVLAFKVSEQKLFSVDTKRMQALGMLPGEWLCELKRRFFSDWNTTEPLEVTTADEQSERKEMNVDAAALYNSISSAYPTRSIGYLTDWGFSAENRDKVLRFFSGTALLIGECAFLHADMHKARSSHHLCTSDWNTLLAELQPSYFLPVHLSKTYQGRSAELYAELTPPAGTTVITLPEHRTHKPIVAGEATFRV